MAGTIQKKKKMLSKMMNFGFLKVKEKKRVLSIKNIVWLG